MPRAVPLKPPEEEEIEVSLFGPGYGECVLLHIGFCNWVIIDSCINPETKNPIALDYLKLINVSTSCVKQIIVTHWHDDHIRGLSTLVENCKAAEIVISEALESDKFVDLLSIYFDEKTIKSGSGLNEFSRTAATLLQRGASPKRAIADRLLYVDRNQTMSYSCVITSLSPSDASILLSNAQLSKFIPKLNDDRKRIPDMSPNPTSVVILVQINKKVILLGSDLEVGMDKNCGWEAIIKSSTKPNERAHIFKIPHHGSENADHPTVWESMLTPNPLTIMTPFDRGKKKLPTDSDIKRILSKKGNSYLTAGNTDRKIKLPNKVDKEMQRFIIKRKIINSNFGHIQLRSAYQTENNDWNIELFGNAYKLTNK